MGGLLAAEAATDPSTNVPGKPKRTIGVVSFDTPFLGMHPHVVITGIASLLPKDGEDKGKDTRSERAMNQHPQVQIVDPKVTDDWEEFKRQAHIRPPLRDHGSAASSNLSLSTSSTSSLRSRTPSPSSQFVDRAVSFISAHSDEPVARWLRKHADDPISAAKRWVVEHLQFGICMFDPSGLKARYTHLVAWEATGGVWVNYYTHTVTADHAPESAHATGPMVDDDEALRVNGILPAPSDTSLLSVSSTTDSDIGNTKAGTASPKKKKKRRHFVVLPTGLGQYLGGLERWEEVPIAGVADEVNAHTGIFIPHQNLEYEALVKRVADRVLEWCQRLPHTLENR
ncbi:hypothetical protein HYPSUDRAFT_132290 [Hypholoma sublateritium FD-334 SS-4]|uniref:Uncharacterized protein n=1 Tax=Hypholoma sublateritium (strain FD-334 SS-4) TaxID=945553 RepID=A0A0D2P7I1_HYPSF|nr:hypothetical protein HYPSUDRAFT_132290 [Hypholoma sublateritium FD-334 SS-4]